MKEKLQRFMYGRYGLDSFGKFTIIVSLVLMLLANFVPARLGKCIIPAVLGTFDLHIFPYVLKTNL